MIYPWNTSAAEQPQTRFPKARVVGAFKNVWREVFGAPDCEDYPNDVLVVGEDEKAKSEIFALSESLSFYFINAGPLRNARTVERITLLSSEIGQRYPFLPWMNYRLMGKPGAPGQADNLNLQEAISA